LTFDNRTTEIGLATADQLLQSTIDPQLLVVAPKSDEGGSTAPLPPENSILVKKK
jgi:hypothetical protein